MRLAHRLLPVGLLLVVLGTTAAPLAAQEASRARIEGRIIDSARARPLGGATVLAIGLNAEPRLFLSTVADAEGRFRLDSLVAGRYALSFSAPVLDSLDLVIPDREVVVAAGTSQRVELALPSGRTLRAAVCPGVPLEAGQGAVVGVVTDALTERPLAGVTVVVLWNDVEVDRATLRATATPRLGSAAADSAGNFRLCGVPTGTAINVQAQRGTLSSSAIELLVDDSLGIVRRDLSFSADSAGAGATRASADTTTLPSLTGSAALSGRVTGSTGEPLRDVQLRILNGRSYARSDSAGRFALTGLPEGTQMLEAKRIGYSARLVPVELRRDRSVSQDVRLSRIVSLDSILIIAQRARYPEFERNRRRRGFGTFLDERDIALRNPFRTGDLMRTTPGLRVESAGFDDIVMSLRGGFSAGGCPVNVVIDGLEGMRISDVHPSDIAGIEIYRGPAGAPSQYRSRCGVIVIWTKK